METDAKDRPPVNLPPPLIFFVLLGAGFLLDYLFPLKYFRLLNITAVGPGEEYLARTFGGRYLEYRAEVRR
jgi:protein-S-isoprenylcysteine O-methyltransferase Ste14